MTDVPNRVSQTFGQDTGLDMFWLWRCLAILQIKLISFFTGCEPKNRSTRKVSCSPAPTMTRSHATTPVSLQFINGRLIWGGAIYPVRLNMGLASTVDK